MTDSLSAIPDGSQRGGAGAQGGKRERLIAAAAETIYAAGVEKTTLADIAAAAGIPLGNVYYYFKTKDALVQAVVEAHQAEARAMLAAIDARLPGAARAAQGAVRRPRSAKRPDRAVRLPARLALPGTGQARRRRAGRRRADARAR